MQSGNRLLLFIVIALVAVGGIAAFVLFKPAPEQAAPTAQGDASASPVAQASQPWTKRCDNGEPKTCEIFQRLIATESKARLIEVAVSLLENGESGRIALILPLGILVNSGVAIQVDEGAPRSGQIRTCGQGGCFAVFDLPKTFLDSMKSGKILNVGFYNGAQKPVKIQMTLQGFSETVAQLP